jgi:nucleoside-diphosphate-sugar epimerase
MAAKYVDLWATNSGGISMAYMVTGGTGFIGSWVVKAIMDQGHKVVCFEGFPNAETHPIVLGDRADEVTVVNGDLLHLHRIVEVIQKYEITHIAHIAAATLRVCEANPPYAMQVNVTGMTNMLEACRMTGIKKMAWASSAGIFGGSYFGEAIANDARVSPPSIYAGSKVLGENLSEHYFTRYGVDSIGMRYTFVNGHGMPNSLGGKMIDNLCYNPAQGKPGQVPWGEDSPDWLWGYDAGRATIMALDAPTTKSRAFNICGDNAKVADAVDYVRSLIPDADLTVDSGKMGFSELDGSVAEAEFGYRPETTMEMAMKLHINQGRKLGGLPPLD